MEVLADLVKELLGTSQDVLELGQLQEVLLQGFLVGVDLLQLVLQLLKRGLSIKQRQPMRLGFRWDGVRFKNGRRGHRNKITRTDIAFTSCFTPIGKPFKWLPLHPLQTH